MSPSAFTNTKTVRIKKKLKSEAMRLLTHL